MKVRNNSISKNFVLFILASIIFWFLTKLSKEYESTIDYPVVYENLPKDKLLQEEPVKEIGVHIKTTGFKVISAKLFPRTLKIDGTNLYQKTSSSYYLLLNQQKLSIQRQMTTGVDIEHFIKDSISFSLGLLSQKKVPIRLNANLSYDTGYDVNGNISITPDSVLVSGPEAILDTIQFVETRPLIRSDINKSIEEELSLKRFAGNNTNLAVEKVAIKATIEKFTEGSIKAPFVVKNLPDSIRISTFPKELDITYKIALSSFNDVKPSSFRIECDYRLSTDNNLTYLVPKLVQQSNLVKNVKISPQRIDFFIEK